MDRTRGRRLAVFAGAALAGVLAVVAVADTRAWWVVAAAVLMVLFLTAGITAEVWSASPFDDDAPEDPSTDPVDGSAAPDEPGPDFRGPDAPERVLVVTAEPIDADRVLDALTREMGCPPHRAGLGVMVVSPEGFGGRDITNDQGRYDAARRAEADTVASLRRARIKAAGHVGDHDAAQAIADALELFPAQHVLVFGHGDYAATALPMLGERTTATGA